MMQFPGQKTRIILAAGILILSSIVAVNLLLENPPVVIQVEGEKFKVLEIPYSYTRPEAYMLLFAGLFAGLSLSQLLVSLKVSPFYLDLESIFVQTPDSSETVQGPFETLNFAALGDQKTFESIKSFADPDLVFKEKADSEKMIREEPDGGPEGGLHIQGQDGGSEGGTHVQVPDGETQAEAQKRATIAEVVSRVLEGDEKKAFRLILENGGRMRQNELVNSLNFSKAKVSRILMSLEKRGILTKDKYGLTNCITLAEDIMGDMK